MKLEKEMHQPGIEPGSVPWQGTIPPLDHWCFVVCCRSFFVYVTTVFVNEQHDYFSNQSLLHE